ncbi:MAG: molybdopterin-guanine dinucleotide biosynthesis protein B [Actinobacteria bacterium]|nr:molybdopterin-guanine dinucleotide biosynthesis protein B [Actinomycetota bacterium]
MTVVVGVVGPSGVGKTSLAERLIARFSADGVRVGYLKHAHKGFSHDVPGKDSWRARAAGAEVVVLSGGDRFVIDGPDHVDPRVLAAGMPACDLVLAEGFSDSPWPKIVVHRLGFEPREVAPPVLIEVEADERGRTPDDDLDRAAKELASLLEAGNGTDVHLVVDGQWVPVDGFPGQILAGSVLGMLANLKGVPADPSVIELRIRPRR